MIERSIGLENALRTSDVWFSVFVVAFSNSRIVPGCLVQSGASTRNQNHIELLLISRLNIVAVCWVLLVGGDGILKQIFVRL